MYTSSAVSIGRPVDYPPSFSATTAGFESKESKPTDSQIPAVTVDTSPVGDPFEKSEHHKELIEEMFPGPKIMGEFEDKKGIEQAKDLAIGPDIRCALTSKNPKYIKRLMTGLVTIAEYRELAYRYRELKARQSDHTNLLEGELIEKDGLRVVQEKVQLEELEIGDAKGSLFSLKV